MNKVFLIALLFFVSTGVVYAFSNSLDGTREQSNPMNNFASPGSNTYQNIPNTPLNPKEHTNTEHSNSIYSNPQMNDTRYNSNCQFGQCIPGGLNPGYR